ncbi:MAG: hypothetical protein MZV70_29280 [Desulfobacterales bacterium]|nr:hypothetical protein [Desulfobacterales bacterium]
MWSWIWPSRSLEKKLRGSATPPRSRRTSTDSRYARPHHPASERRNLRLHRGSQRRASGRAADHRTSARRAQRRH